MQKPTNFEHALKTKYPEQVAIAIAKDANGNANPITLGWVMQTSHNPPMFAISVAPQRYSHKAIKQAGCFTLIFPSADMADLALFFGTKSGRNIDKFKESDCKIEPAKVVDSVLMTDAVANFECVVESETITGDHSIFTGKVVASYVNTEPKKRLYTIGTGYKMGTAD